MVDMVMPRCVHGLFLLRTNEGLSDLFKNVGRGNDSLSHSEADLQLFAIILLYD